MAAKKEYHCFERQNEGASSHKEKLEKNAEEYENKWNQ